MINEKIEAGVVNRLLINRNTDYGFFLKANNEEEVLLPNAYITDDMYLEDEIDVFIYHDSEDRIIATTQRPHAMLGEYGYFEVVNYQRYGAFVNWGLAKDLFVPLSQQKTYFNIGMKFILRVCLDKETGRLYATHKIGKFMVRDMKGLFKTQEVDIMIMAKTPLGYKAIVNNKYEGMIYENEIFEKIKIGEKRKAYIKLVRKDFKLDLSLQAIGKAKEGSLEDKVLEVLKYSNSAREFNYKSSPEDIHKTFNLSKKNFKKALTLLLDKEMIKFEDNKIKMITKQ